MNLLEDLARSGLTKKDAKTMGLRPVSPDGVKKVSKGLYNVDSYQIPYFDFKGKREDFFRLKFLEPTTDRRTGKSIRYWQPPRTPPKAYFPQCVDWKAVLEDPSISILITEGEKKAYAGARFLKRPVIGLGGVWSFGAKKERTVMLPELIPFMKGRDVIIVFDHEPTPNPDVNLALHALARASRGYGGRPTVLALPELNAGEKAGLDDVLVAKGAEFVLSIDPQPLEDEAQLEAMNKELAYIDAAAAIYHLPTSSLYDRPQRLVQVIYSDRNVVRFDAKGNAIEKNLAGEWLKWPRRRRHKAIAYEPGQGEMLEDGSLNVWKGWGVAPKKGDVSPWRKLLDQVFADGDEAHRKWFLQWLAYPLQHPGVKMYAGVLMFSILQGVGKSLLGMTMKRIYGENFVLLEAEQLHGQFNGWARHRQFVLGDEVTGRDDRAGDANRLKNIITKETVTINAKFQVPYDLPDRANWYLTTNHPDAMSLENDDRRMFIWEIRRQTLPEDWYTKAFDPWYKNPVNAAAVFHYLLNVDLKGFDPRAKAPMTDAKYDMQSLSGGHVDALTRDLLAAPDRFLIGHTRDLYMAHELAQILEPNGRMSPVSLAKAMRRAGVRPFTKTRTTRGVFTLYPVRDRGRWEKATHKQRAEHYDGVTSK